MATSKNSSKQAEDFIKNSFNGFAQNIDALSGFTKETVDAIVKSSSVTSKNVEGIMSEALNCAKSNVESCVSVAKDIAGARTVDQLIAIQTEQSKKYFENSVSQFTKMSELWMNLSKEASAPISEQANSFTDKFMKTAA